MGKQVIIFDLDDTLLWDEKCVKDAFQATCQLAGRYHVIDPDALETEVRAEAKALYQTYEFYPFTLNIGINPFEGLWGNFNDEHHLGFAQMKEQVPSYRTESWTRGLHRLGVDDPELGKRLGEVFPLERRKRSILYPDTFQVLDELKSNYRLVLLTNGSPELQQEKLSAAPKLRSYFEHIFISGEFGQGKPSRALYEHVMETVQMEAEQGVMVGDKLTTDIAGANGIGMTSVWINRHHVVRDGEVVPDFEIYTLTELLEVMNQLG